MSRHGESIYKRKDRRWEGRCIRGRSESGKAIYKSVYAYSYAECRRKLDELKIENPVSEKRLTVARLFDIWLESRKNSVKQSTYMNYRMLYENYIKDFFGAHPCASISSEALNKYASFLLESGGSRVGGLSVKSVRSVLMILRSMFKYANSEYGIDDPVRNVTLPKSSDNKIELFDDDEIRTLYKLVESDDLTRFGIALCLNTGMRIGELCALKWSDIDLSENVLHIRKTLQRINNPNGGTPKTIVVITEPKSRKSARDIPIPSCLATRLKALRQDGENYFLTASECFTEPRTFTDKYSKCLKEINVNYRNFHCLRHTFATKCIQAGADIKTVSELLGHSSVQITLDRYVHSDIEIKRTQINKLSGELFAKL